MDITYKDEGKEVLEIDEKDLKKLNLEEKEAIRSKLAQSHSIRLNTLSKWQSIFIGIIVTAFISALTLFLQGYFILSILLIAISIEIILYLYFKKYYKAQIQEKRFGNWIRAIEKSIREDLKNKLNKEVKKRGGKYPVQFPIEY